MSRKLLTLSLTATLMGGTAYADTPQVAVDIAPVHSLVARVMEGVAVPDLIIQPGASPHEYSLRPSEAAALQASDLVFWVGPGLTPWLADTIETLAQEASVTALSKLDGTVKLEFRESAVFEVHDLDDHSGHDDHADHDADDDHADHDDHAGENYLEPTQSDELTLGYYISNQLDFAHIDFGVRYDRIDRETEDGHSYEDSLLSFSFAVSKQLSDNLGVSLGLSSVEKAPSAMELFVDGDHMVTQLHEVGDDSLTAEKANNIDLSFNTAASGFDVELSLFKNSISDFIYLNRTGEFNVTADVLDDLELEIAEYMQQDATFEGYELQISRSINVANGSLVASLGRDYVDAQFDQGGFIPRTVPTRNLVSLNYSGNDGLNWLVSLKDIQGQSKVAANEEATDGYQWLDVKLSKGFKLSNTEVLNVSVFAKNLMNKVARNHSSFVKEEVPLPGKNIGIKAKLSF